MMRILLLNQFFWPDLAATSQLLTDLARHLAEQGHEVTVVCARSSYAGADGHPPPPVRILRVPNLAFSKGAAGRLLSYASFWTAAAWRGLWLPRQDLVVSLTTPPLLSVLGSALQWRHRSRHYIWEMDLYPDVALDVGVMRPGSAVTRIVGAIADYTRRRADGIIALGECMRRRIAARGIDASRIRIAENWADGNVFYPPSRRASEGPLTVVYQGNLGLAHDTETISEAMKLLKDDSRIRFEFVGGGAKSKQLEEFCRTHGIANVFFLPHCNREELNQRLAEAHIGLVTQTASCVGSLVPSKVYSLLAAGLPLLYIGPGDATPAQLLRRFDCGWHIGCGDPHAVVGLLASLAENRRGLSEAAVRARNTFLQHYDTPVGVRRVAEILGLGRADSLQPARPRPASAPTMVATRTTG